MQLKSSLFILPFYSHPPPCLFPLYSSPPPLSSPPLPSPPLLLSPEALAPEDLDQLSSLIADALQVVDLNAPGPGLTRDRPEPRDLEQEQQEEQGGEERRGGEGGEEEEEEEEEEEKVEEVSTMKTLEGSPIQEAELRGDWLGGSGLKCCVRSRVKYHTSATG